MDFYEVVRRRRMVRNYTDEPVDADAVERMVDAARKAPSAGFSQGHSLVVVTDVATRRQIAGLAGEAEYVSRGYHPWISRAPVHVVVCIREESYHERYRERDKVDEAGRELDWPIPYWWVDAGGVMMTLLLAAVAEGLAAGFLGSHTMAGLPVLLALPDDVTPLGVVTVGHPAPDHPSASLRRGWRERGEVVHYDRWGQGLR